MSFLACLDDSILVTLAHRVAKNHARCSLLRIQQGKGGKGKGRSGKGKSDDDDSRSGELDCFIIIELVSVFSGLFE